MELGCGLAKCATCVHVVITNMQADTSTEQPWVRMQVAEHLLKQPASLGFPNNASDARLSLVVAFGGG